MARYPARSASFIITLFGIIVNTVFTGQILAASSSLHWEPEFEWEFAGDTRRVDSVKLVWALLVAYFASAAVVCIVGFVGVVKNKSALVRFYRDYSLADFAFCIGVVFVGVYSAFRPSTREGVCEELSRQPELMHDMVEMGLSVENCERWFERAVMAFVAVMVIVNVARLHFLVAVSNYYYSLVRWSKRDGVLPSHTHRRSLSRQRIFLLPRNLNSSDNNCDVIYAPVPLSELSSEQKNMAREAWVMREQASSPTHTRTHSRQHTRYENEPTGRISLPIRPGEGLFSSKI